MFHVEPQGSWKPNMEEKFSITELVNKLPQKPGVYQFLNASHEMLYIGKAKNLRKRVASYFVSSDSHSYKHDALVKKIIEIKYILVENESEALLLENNLIKEYKPRYNILLKDDKTYPWISIKKERFPRVMQTRNYIEDGSEYFGPYTSVVMVKTLLDLIRQLYKLRTCKLALTEKGIEQGKYKRCLEFHLGNCKAPCEGLQSEEDYGQSIAQIREILNGHYQQVILHLKNLMKSYARQLKFEEAEVIKQKISILEKFRGKSTIVNPRINNVDVFSIIDEDNYAYVNFLKIVNGAIVQAHNLEIQKMLREDKMDVLTYIMFDLRARFRSDAREIIVPFRPDISMEGASFTVPRKGDKWKLLELSKRNAVYFRNDKVLLRAQDKWSEKELNMLTRLQHDLKLKKLPVQIECFDNSNIQGANPVASCVVFRSGRPYKSDYRHYNIKTVTGPNDYASMEEIITGMLSSRVPIVVYVAPSGAKAASAGFFILLAADVAAMAPGTNTGAAHPLMAIGGFPVDGGQAGKTLTEKITSNSTAFLRSIASKRNRNVAEAEKGVVESKSFTDTEALQARLIDFIARDENELLAKFQLGISRGRPCFRDF